MKRRQISKKEVKEINLFVQNDYGVSDLFSKKDDLFIIEDENEIIFANNQPVFFKYSDKLVPTLKFLLVKALKLKFIVIDMPAVKFIVSGADVMRPGIKEFSDNIQKGDVVLIVDENNKKPIAIGISTLSSSELAVSDKGKVIKNIHYVGDKIWNSSV